MIFFVVTVNTDAVITFSFSKHAVVSFGSAGVDGYWKIQRLREKCVANILVSDGIPREMNFTLSHLTSFTLYIYPNGKSGVFFLYRHTKLYTDVDVSIFRMLCVIFHPKVLWKFASLPTSIFINLFVTEEKTITYL